MLDAAKDLKKKVPIPKENFMQTAVTQRGQADLMGEMRGHRESENVL